MNKFDAVTIRSARMQDWPQIRDFLQANALPLDGADVHVADFLVAEKDGAVCGCAGLEYHDASALLRSCAADHHNRGQGVGRELVRRAISSAQVRGITQIVLLTTTAERFFPQFGFQTITRAGIPIDGGVHTRKWSAQYFWCVYTSHRTQVRDSLSPLLQRQSSSTSAAFRSQSFRNARQY